MGFLDSAQSAINKGVSGAGRATKQMQLKSQLSDVSKERDKKMAQLGASVYDEIKGDPKFRASREALFASIEEADNKAWAIRDEITQIDGEKAMEAQSRATANCPICGRTLNATDSFCVGCGTGVAALKAQMGLCPNCGSPIKPDAKFCTICGVSTVQDSRGQPPAGLHS